MSGAGDDYKAQVKAATDIVELIGRTVALRRRGRDYVGLCPFHQEKTPSFTVSQSKQMFYCYGCKAAGDVFSFVQRRDRVEFPEALRILGEQAGIEPPYGDGSRKSDGKQALFDMQSAAAGFFEKSLADPEIGSTAREYLAQRRIDADSIARFRIGFARDAWDALLRSPIARNFTARQLETAGLVKPRQNGQGYYDTFRNRLMFPIRDANSRVIAFGGRVMPGSPDPAKYLNSPETPLFSKSACVFGIDLARQKIVETRTAVVVEGYTDVIVAHQCGVTNVVSVLGTAMTEQHVTILRRLADRIVLLFDADTAGDAAVDRVVGLFLTQPVEIAIASMPAGVDPDEFALEHGAEAFENLISGAADALSYKWRQLARQFDASEGNLTGRQKAVEAYLSVLVSARGSGPVDAIRWGAALTRVSRLTEMPVEDLNRRFGRSVAPWARRAEPVADQPAAAQPPAGPLTAQARAERWILGILLLQPERWHEVQKLVSLEDFADSECRKLAEIHWNHQREEGVPVFNEFLGALPDSALTELAMSAVEEVESLADPDRVLAEALAYFDRQRRVREEQRLIASSRRDGRESDGMSDIELLRAMSERRRKADLWRT